MENMRVPELKALARERGLRGYSRLRKAELTAFLQDNAPQGAPGVPGAPKNLRPRDDRDPQGPQGGLSPPLCEDLLHRCLLGNL